MITKAKVTNKPKEKGSVTYTTAYILKRLREHMVTNKLSAYSMTAPTLHGINKRIKEGDTELAEGVETIKAEHYAVFEQKLNDAIFNGDDINMAAFNVAVRNKKPFVAYETLELEERIQQLEESQDGK